MIGSNPIRVRSLCLAIVLLACASQVTAQTEGNISVGVDYGIDIPMSDALDQKSAFGVSFRLPRPQGFSAAWDFGALTADLQHSLRGNDVAIGELTARSVLGGAAYSVRGSRVELTAIVTGGISFSKLDLSDAGKLGIRAPSGVADEHAEGNVAPAFEPKLTLWIDLNRWFAVGGNTSYMWQRPKVTLTNAAGTVEEFKVNADMLRLSVGLVVRVF
jgi:hypothetical protein